jgi:hypothetical protein
MEALKYCKDEDCQDTWDIGKPECKCGESDHIMCQNYIGNKETKEGNKEQINTKHQDGLLLNWHSNAMGELDIAWLNVKRLPLIIGVIGPADAGKTTLLATLYMLLRGGKSIGDYTFAGSYTLLGWEKLAHPLSFNMHKKIYFPPHTSSKEARLPGLLHLALKDKNDNLQDILFTDAPGEWFTNWAKSADAPESKGARWIDENADAFVIVSDTKAFSESIGASRRVLVSIAERMKNTYQNRPTVLAWTKATFEIDNTIKTGISERVKKNLSDVKVFDTAVIDINEETAYLLDNILEIFSHLITEKYSQKNKKPIVSTTNTDDFFFSIRNNYASEQ